MSKFDDAYLRMQQFGSAMLGRLADAKADIDRIRSGERAVLRDCPSQASAIETFHLSRIQRDLQEVVAAMKEAREELYRECGE